MSQQDNMVSPSTRDMQSVRRIGLHQAWGVLAGGGGLLPQGKQVAIRLVFNVNQKQRNNMNCIISHAQCNTKIF